MASQGPLNPATAADNAGTGTIVWTNPGNIFSSNNVYATSVYTSPTPTNSHFLIATNFGFSIPAGATIDGVVVEVETGTTGAAFENIIKLVKGGVVSGSNLVVGFGAWPGPDTIASFGSSSNLWGNTLTYSDINASDFGVAYSVTGQKSGKSNVTIRVDHIRITVYYTGGGGGGGSNSAFLAFFRKLGRFLTWRPRVAAWSPIKV